MKRIFFYFITAFCIAALASCTATYVVRERPAEVVYVRPAPPSHEHVWISGDWVWVGGRYEWHEGHYERRREGYRWEDGHWQTVRGGYKWVPGHWKTI
ncbi:MAG TPA: hypothetical protein VMI35_00370 [Puia sp.]|nr:hypothetical protein [Puia sp.]